MDSSVQNHAESFGNYVKNSVLDPKHAKLNQNSDFGHVRTYSWLHKSGNTQGKIHGTYLGNIYGIYKEYIRNIHKYLWYKIIRMYMYMTFIRYILGISINIYDIKYLETQAPPSAAPHWVCVSVNFLIILYHRYLWIFLIYSSYIPYIFPKYVPYIFPCAWLNLWSEE